MVGIGAKSMGLAAKIIPPRISPRTGFLRGRFGLLSVNSLFILKYIMVKSVIYKTHVQKVIVYLK